MLVHIILINIIIDLLSHLLVLLLVEALSTLGHVEWHALVLAHSIGMTYNSAGVHVIIILRHMLSSRYRSPTYPCTKNSTFLP